MEQLTSLNLLIPMRAYTEWEKHKAIIQFVARYQ